MNATFIDPISLFLVLRGRLERQCPTFPETVQALKGSVCDLERILSGGRLRDLDRMGDVPQPAKRIKAGFFRRKYLKRFQALMRGCFST